MEKIISTTRRPDIIFHENGKICITARVSRILRLSAWSCINVAKEDGEHLLFAEHYDGGMIGRHACRCHPVNGNGSYFRANSVRLCRAILQECGASGRAALMCGEAVSIHGKTYLPIITRTAL